MTTRRTAGTVILQPYGDIDLATVGDLDDALQTAEATGATTIVVELAAVNTLDSTGLGCLVAAHERVRKADRELVIRPGTPRIRRLFEGAGLTDVLSTSP